MQPLALSFVILLALCAHGVAGGENLQHRCDGSQVQVLTSTPADIPSACAGAADALDFFSRLGLAASDPLTIEIVTRLPDRVRRSAAGCYVPDERRILLLSFDRFERQETWFNVPIDRAMYRSLVAHEVAHAITDCHFAVPDPTIQAQEYVAYAAMFATMEPELRERILAAMPGHGFDSELKINANIYLCDPMHFGVEAYRHYLQEGRGATYLLEILAGAALTYREGR